MSDELRTALRGLVELGVGMEVKDGRAALTLPEKEPQRSKAEKAVRAELETIRACHDKVIALWPEVATEARPDVWVCRECKALVLDPSEGATSRWAFCGSTYCPYRLDEPARRAQQRWLPPGEQTWRGKKADQERARAIALGEDVPEPIPD